MDEHWVRLQVLPHGVVFPGDLQGRIYYDPERKRLVFRGFMTKADYDRLSGLHNDFHYQRAIHHLFAAAESNVSWQLSVWIILGVVISAALLAIWFLKR